MITGHIQLNISISDDYQEFLIAELSELGFDGFEQENNLLKCYISQNKMTDAIKEEILLWLSNQSFKGLIVSEQFYEVRNWNALWESSIKPVQIGRFWVTPTWSDVPVPTGSIKLVIDPKMAFGTGYHETTRLILSNLHNFVKKGHKVLDIGTGTGILAIAAIKLGAVKAFGFDIDEWSEKNAVENSWLNDTGKLFEVKLGSFEQIPANAIYDVVLANVILDMLLIFSSQITKRVKQGGVLVLSGLLREDESVILLTPAYNELKHLDTIYEGEWCVMNFKKG